MCAASIIILILLYRTQNSTYYTMYYVAYCDCAESFQGCIRLFAMILLDVQDVIFISTKQQHR